MFRYGPLVELFYTISGLVIFAAYKLFRRLLGKNYHNLQANCNSVGPFADEGLLLFSNRKKRHTSTAQDLQRTPGKNNCIIFDIF